jgi:hypothetical protein
MKIKRMELDVNHLKVRKAALLPRWIKSSEGKPPSLTRSFFVLVQFGLLNRFRRVASA